LVVDGELDALTGPALGTSVAEQLETKRALVIDLSTVGFIDSSGLGVLVKALKRTREVDGQLKLVITSTATLKLMAITGLNLAFDIVPDVETATSTPPSTPAG
jgi:anti-anti-sigma factor